VVDGAKRLRKAMSTVFGTETPVQRCQWYKRENAVGYPTPSQQMLGRRKLRGAYKMLTCAEAKAVLLWCRHDLGFLNESAVDEGPEKTFTLRRLSVFRELGLSLKAMNCLRSLNSLVAQRMAKVDRWRSSEPKQRWLAAVLLDIEPRLRRIEGFRALALLRRALVAEIRCEDGTTTILAA